MRKNLKLHCLGLASLERTIARLRSRVLHLKDGDANTKFFHQHARYRKKKIISKLHVGDQVVSNMRHFSISSLICSGMLKRGGYSFELFVFHSQQQDLSQLDAPFTAEEVWATVKDMPLDKAPNPGGFT